METKSRYEVIAELEGKKRDLIKERDGLEDEVKEKEDQLRNLKRQKEDNITALDRSIEDAEYNISRFRDTMDERKITINALIESVNESLDRFGKLGDKK